MSSHGKIRCYQQWNWFRWPWIDWFSSPEIPLRVAKSIHAPAVPNRHPSKSTRWGDQGVSFEQKWYKNVDLGRPRSVSWWRWKRNKFDWMTTSSNKRQRTQNKVWSGWILNPKIISFQTDRMETLYQSNVLIGTDTPWFPCYKSHTLLVRLLQKVQSIGDGLELSIFDGRIMWLVGESLRIDPLP